MPVGREPQSASVATRLAQLAAMPLRLYPSVIATGLCMGTLLLLANVIRRPNVEVDLSTLPTLQDRSQMLIPRWDSGWPWTWRRESDPEYDSRPQLLAPGKATVGISPAAIALNLSAILGGAVLAAAACQKWRSCRQAIWQLHLRDLLALTATTALVVSWVLACRSVSTRQFSVVAARRGPAPRSISSSAAPQQTVRWSRVCDSPWELCGGDSGLCVVGLEADGDELHLAARLPQLRTLRVNRGATSEQLQKLMGLARLESLHVTQPPRPAVLDERLREILEKLRPGESIRIAPIDGPPPLPLELQPELVLPPLRTLRGLSLVGAPFRGAGLKQLSALEALDLSGTLIDNAGLQGVRGLTRLRVLSLSRTRVTGTGLEHLRGLSELEELTLGGGFISAAGLAHLANLPQLCRLSLVGVEADDDAVRVLARFPALTELRIGGTRITGQSIPVFSKMRLAQLAIQCHGLSDEEVRQLQLALPEGSARIYPTLPPRPLLP